MLLTYVRMTGYSFLKLVWADVVCEGFIKAFRLELCSKMMDRVWIGRKGEEDGFPDEGKARAKITAIGVNLYY